MNAHLAGAAEKKIIILVLLSPQRGGREDAFIREERCRQR